MALAVSGLSLVAVATAASTASAAEAHVDNPYVGKGYVNPQWKSLAESVAGGSRVSSNPTAVWLDRIAAIEGTANSQSNGPMGLRDHLDAALAQGATYAQFVIYNLPQRDCSALASNGELKIDELPRYKSEYIDPIAAIQADSKYASLRIINIIEIDSLPNTITNTNLAACAAVKAANTYVDGVAYALGKLHASGSNVYNYIDAGHHGWLGWDTNFGPSAELFNSTVLKASGGYATVDGFISNTANYSALSEPYVGDVTRSFNGMPVRSSKWVDWNYYNDESTYVTAFRTKLISLGFPSSIGMLIDTSRNGWGGTNRPTAASTSTDLNTFVNASRVDRRFHKGNWCNQSGAGLGERPTAAPASGIDAYVWIKPPGESDGSSSLIENSDGKGFDRMCDPTYTGNDRNGNSATGALGNAPISGAWFAAQFAELMANAYPALGSGPTGTTTTTTGPTNTTTTTRTTNPTGTTTTQPTTTATTVPTSCAVTWTIDNSWQGGMQATVTVKNTGSSALSSWTVGATLPAGQTIGQVYNGTFTQSGQSVTIKNAAYNGTIAPGATASTGMQLAWTSSNGPATNLTLNGVPCGTTTTTTSSTTTTSTTPTSTTTSNPTTTTTTRATTTTTSRATTTTTTTPDNGTHVDNPYVGKGYVNPQWKALAESVSGGSRVSSNPTAVWLDRIAAIEGTANSQSNGPMGLRDHLDAALAQGATYAQFVIYNLPQRDCSALASNGELKIDELPRYKSEYIDPIAAIQADSKYRSLRIINIIEIDSLPNTITNTNLAACAAVKAANTYVDGVAYALGKLHAAGSNVYNYIDAGHHGWLGWDTNFGPSAELFNSTVLKASGGYATVDGFISNTANYSALSEPYVGDVTRSFNGMPVRSSKWVDWNYYNDESTYVTAFRTKLISLGFPSGIGMLIDTSRNGWGGSNRPTAASTSTDLNTFVNASRVDRRFHKGNWCNQSGAGLGERPTAAPASGIDAYVWIKPPGESDGSSSLIENSDGKGFDRMCDPTYTGNDRNGNSATGALGNAPISGAWFAAQFAELMANAYPPLGSGPTGTTTTTTTTSRPTSTTTTTTTSRPTSTTTTTSRPTTTTTTTSRPTTTTTTTTGTGSCAVSWTVTGSWQSGLQGEIVIKNTGTSTLNGWTVGATLPSGQTITQVFNGTFSQSGQSVTIKNAAYNGTIAPGATASTGFLASWTSNNGVATNLTLNGAPCGTTPTGTSTTTTSSRPTSTTTTTTTTRPTTTTTTTPQGTTPLAINGQLSVKGTNLVNQYGKAIQLRGMSTHGLQWFWSCYSNGAALDELANDWKADLLRVAMYVQEDGYVTNPSLYTSRVNTLVDAAESRGMYAIIDFHTLTPGDPNSYLSDAKTFFQNVSSRNASKKNVIYEIANEPNGVSWSTIKQYADQVIPIIKANDPDAVIIVGTPGWSSMGMSGNGPASDVINNKLSYSNIMYTFHFYAASHGDSYRSALQSAASQLPMFVTEFGIVEYTGTGNVDTNAGATWLNLLDSLKISYAGWNLSDASETGAAFKANTCASGNYGTSNLQTSGTFMRSRIMTQDNFPTS